MPDPVNAVPWQELAFPWLGPGGFTGTRGRLRYSPTTEQFAYQGSEFQFEEEEPLDPEFLKLLIVGYLNDQERMGKLDQRQIEEIGRDYAGLINSGRLTRANLMSLHPSIATSLLSNYDRVIATRKQPGKQGELIGSNLIRLPDGSFTDKSGQPINQQVGEMMWQKAFRDLQPDTGTEIANPQSIAAQQKSFINQAKQDFEMKQRALMRNLTQRERALDGQQREAFEQARQQALGQLTNPIDWVERLKVETRGNPFARQPITSAERLRGLEEKVERTQRAAQRAATMFPSSTEIDLQEPGRTVTMAQQFAEGDILRADSALRQLGKAQTEGIAPKEGDKPRRQDFPIPDWLSSLYPSQFQRGGRTTLSALGKAQVAPISASVWNKLPWTTQQGFLGLARFQGQAPQDILGLMARQLPQPRGVTRARPARQRTSV